MKRWTAFAFAACLSLYAAHELRADFSYQQQTKLTGGAMLSTMKLAARFSKGVRQSLDSTSTVYVKGGRMSIVSPDSMQIIDVGAETITHVDLREKTFSVTTFAEMQAAMRAMMKKMQGKNPQETQAEFDLKVEDTGRSGTFAGLPVNQKVMRLGMKMSDPKSRQQAAFDVVADMWLAGGIRGYEELTQVSQILASKLGFDPQKGMNAVLMQQQGASQGMAKLYQEAAKLQGVPVLQIVKMAPAGQPVKISEVPQAPEAQQAQQQGPNMGEAVKKSILGGLGGFGRRRQEEPPAQPQQTPQQAEPVLMEITTISSGFSSAPVADSNFRVPEGCRQVESEFAKLARE